MTIIMAINMTRIMIIIMAIIMTIVMTIIMSKITTSANDNNDSARLGNAVRRAGAHIYAIERLTPEREFVLTNEHVM